MMKRSEIRKRKQKSKRKKYGIIIGILIIVFIAINSINGNENNKNAISHDSTEKKHGKFFKKKMKKESQDVNKDKPKKKAIKKKIIEKKVTEKETKQQRNKPKKKIKRETKVKNDSTKKEDTKKDRKKDKLKSINTEIRERLEQDQGFALGQLDENGHPTENGTPNIAFAWSVVVKRIEYNERDDKSGGNVTVYVNSSFKDFSVSEKNQVALKSQNIAIGIVGERYKYSMEQYREGLLTRINCEGNNVGKSKFFNHQEFKWDN